MRSIRELALYWCDSVKSLNPMIMMCSKQILSDLRRLHSTAISCFTRENKQTKFKVKKKKKKGKGGGRDFILVNQCCEWIC